MLPIKHALFDLLGPTGPPCADLEVLGPDYHQHGRPRGRPRDLQGKRACGLSATLAPCTVVSIGSNDEWGFERAVAARTPCQVRVSRPSGRGRDAAPARAEGRGHENAQATSGCLRHRHHGMSQLAVFDCTIKPTAAVPADLRHRASLARTCVGGVSSSSAASHQVLRICPVWLVGPPGWSWSTICATWTAPTDRRSCCCGKARNRESPQMLLCVAERVAAIA